MSKKPLKFVPFHTFVDPAFWAEVNRRRLDEWQLDCPEVEVAATFNLCNVEVGVNLGLVGKVLNDCALSLGHDAFSGHVTQSGQNAVINGRAKLFGTAKDFQTADRKYLLSQLKDEDLKQYSYYYVNCVPALLIPPNLTVTQATLPCDLKAHTSAFNYFKKSGELFFFLDSESNAKSLKELPEVKNIMLVFLNPSSIQGHPGWSVRNLLAAVMYHRYRTRVLQYFFRPIWTSVKLLALRGTSESSYIMDVEWQNSTSESDPEAVGWGKPASVCLKSVFDPVNVDMNLKLVRWRLVPSLKLEKLASLKVLMVGSGTLGCNLARALLGWGVKHFTFLDNSVVSYNNPVRQSLFEFEDSKAGNRSKSVTAAEALKRIYPSVDTKGINMKIPMPGHPISPSEKEKVKETCDFLEELIKQHDIVFLVMDSRESRWLPTLLATQHDTLTVTVALGFDSFVVMRHGMGIGEVDALPSTLNSEQVPGHCLGCYYCSDVTAPGNSMDDRTLDQNCTITRAGISQIASGIAVELVASVVQHEMGGGAPALASGLDDNSSILGATPHQVRGFLSRYHFFTPTVRRFQKCTACGDSVQKTFTQDGFNFLESVFNDSQVLEQVSGLAELQMSMGDVNLDMLGLDETDSD